MLLTGVTTVVVSSLPAVLTSTTVSSSSVSKMVLGSSRTLGVPVGVNKVSLDLLTVTLAVLLMLLLSPPLLLPSNDKYYEIISYNLKLFWK